MPEKELQGCGVLPAAADVEALSSFLQVGVETHRQEPRSEHLSADLLRELLAAKAIDRRPSLERSPEQASSLLLALENISNCTVAVCYALSVAVLCWIYFRGLPKKQPQHPSVRHGGSTSLVLFLGTVYAFAYFATDQYVPSMPQMEVDLHGSQTLLSASVQLNLVVKAVSGVLSASLSDRIGRKPVLLVGTVLLSLASFCCGCAGRIEWFLAARVLQGMGESVEPVVFAMARDFFPQREERFLMVAAMKMLSFVGIALAPFVGGLCAEFFSWRVTFFGLAVVWALLFLYAVFAVEESCPDIEVRSYLSDISQILDPHLLILLLAESFIFGGYFSFTANISYLMEVDFGFPILSSSFCLLGFAVLCGVGTFCVERLRLSRVLDTAKVALTGMGFAGLIHLCLGLLLPGYLGSYLTGTALQAFFNMICAVSCNVLLLEPLASCAGMAASCEILAMSILPSAISIFATQCLIQQGPIGLILVQATSCFCAGLVFWLGYASSPPAWTLETEEQAPRKAPPKLPISSSLSRLDLSQDFFRETSPVSMYLRRQVSI